jgi:DNA-binding NtrC family response regulator
LQAKLLRVLQEQEVEPLGSNQVQRIDVRVIAATSRDLAVMVADGRFRADLYYRLNVLPIRLPPLRERMADLEALVEALSDDIARRSGLAAKPLSADALDSLARHGWPGNIRELRNVLEQATLMTDDPLLTPAHFAGALAVAGVGAGAAAVAVPVARVPTAPPTVVPGVGSPPPASTPPRPLPEQKAELERAAIADALRTTGGNRMAAARLLKISRASFYDRLARYPELAG